MLPRDAFYPNIPSIRYCKFEYIYEILVGESLVSTELFYVKYHVSSSGSLVMEHPGEASTPFQGCILFGTVNGTIGKTFCFLSSSF